MSSTRFLIVSLCSFVLVACSVNKQNDEWVSLHDNLYQSKATGDLAIQTSAMTADGIEDVYITHLGVAGDGTDPKLKDVIDKWTFQKLDYQIYKDKNNVYYHRIHSDGGFLYPVGADTNTFTMIGACFAKDKNSIYYISGSSGMGVINVDYDTFKTCFGCGCSAKDKNGLYIGDKKLNLTNSEDKEIYQSEKEAYDYLEEL